MYTRNRKIHALATLVCALGILMVTTGCDPTLSAISLTPASASLARGTTGQVLATGTYSDGSTADLTSVVTWTSANPTIATVNATPGNKGLVTALALGSCGITASQGNFTAAISVTVTDAVITGLSIHPSVAAIAKGTTQAFTATALFSNGSHKDVSALATWTSSSPQIATLPDPTAVSTATALSPGLSTLTAAYGGQSGSTSLIVTNATLSSIAVTANSPTMAKGTLQPFIATGTFSDASTQDLTSLVTWSSADNTMATISNAPGQHGLLTSIKQGSVQISASLGATSGNLMLNVTDAALTAVTIGSGAQGSALAMGTSLQLAARGAFSDGTQQDLTQQVTWSSASSAIATVSNTRGIPGLVNGLGTGTTVITAASGSTSATFSVTVTDATLTAIAVTPQSPTLVSGTQQTLIATGTYSDGSTQDISSLVTWSSFNTAIATVSNAGGSHGQVAALSSGTTTLRATFASLNGDTLVNVVSPPSVASVTPPVWSAAGGIVLTVGGANFQSGATVTIGGIAAAGVTFVSATQLTALMPPANLSGAADVVVTNPDNNSGTASGALTYVLPSFDSPVVYGSAGSDINVAVGSGDFNGDGSPDLAWWAGQGTVEFALDKPDGSFNSPMTLTMPGRFNSDFVTVADFNKDGKLDILTADNPWTTVSVFLGKGDGTFQSPVQLYTGTTASVGAVGYVNGDGILDVVLSAEFDNNVLVLIGNGDGSFKTPTTFATVNQPWSIAAGDWNGDGKLDIAVLGAGDMNIGIHLGKGDGTFGAANPIAIGGPFVQDVSSADLDGDGKLDLIVAGSALNVLPGKGDGTFGAAVVSQGGGPSLHILDIDHDGKLDVVSVGAVQLGIGGFSFLAPVTWSSPGADSIVVADFNKDGKPDLAAAINGTGVEVLLNTSPRFN